MLSIVGKLSNIGHHDISDATTEQACELSRPNADSFVAILKPFSLTKSARLRRVLVQATQHAITAASDITQHRTFLSLDVYTPGKSRNMKGLEAS